MSEVRLRPAAEVDLMERTGYHQREGGDALGGRFFDAAIGCLGLIEDLPGAGSPRIGELCDVPGLCSRRLEGFPNGWFYFERNDHIDVVRLLGYAQDLDAILGGVDDNW